MEHNEDKEKSTLEGVWCVYVCVCVREREGFFFIL